MRVDYTMRSRTDLVVNQTARTSILTIPNVTEGLLTPVSISGQKPAIMLARNPANSD